MSFDPSTNAAVIAALTARCDFAQFFVAVTPAGSLISGAHPYQRSFQPVTSNRVQINWSGTYRRQTVSQPPLIVDANMQNIGLAAVLDGAGKILDGLDLQASRDGANPNPYAPADD